MGKAHAAFPDHATDGDGDSRVIIGQLRKNQREIIAASISKFNGDILLDLRVMVPNDASVPTFTAKGIACKITLLPELIALLQRAEQAARERGLIGEVE